MNEQGTLFAFLERKTRTYHAAELASGKVLFKRQSQFPYARSPMFTGDGENLIVGGSMEDRDARIAVVDLNNGREMANKEFTGNLRNYHPVGKSDVGYLINRGVRKWRKQVRHANLGLAIRERKDALRRTRAGGWN